MKPKQIRILVLGESAGQSSLIKYLEEDPLIDITGCFLTLELCESSGALKTAPELDVIVISIRENGLSLDRTLKRLAGLQGPKLVGIFAPNSPERVFADRLHLYVEESADRTGDAMESGYERLKYQIKNARLTAMTERMGITGKWASLPLPQAKRAFVHTGETDIAMIALGASTGGTEAILEILSDLPADMPPILVVQHMPCEFVTLFSKHMSKKCAMQVRLVSGGEKLRRGVIYLTAEDRHLTVLHEEDGYHIKCVEGDKVSGHRPSVDVLFSSVAAAGSRAIGVILTGMGADGTQGLLKMHQAGAYTIGQDRQSSVVYGMPAVAYQLGAVSRQLPLGAISAELMARTFNHIGEVKNEQE